MLSYDQLGPSTRFATLSGRRSCKFKARMNERLLHWSGRMPTQVSVLEAGGSSEGGRPSMTAKSALSLASMWPPCSVAPRATVRSPL